MNTEPLSSRFDISGLTDRIELSHAAFAARLYHQLRGRYGPDGAREILFELSRAEKAAAEKVRHPAQWIRAGSAAVAIFGRAPGPYTLAWRESAYGPRLRLKRSTFAKAKDKAEEIATNLANGQIAQNSFTESDRARWLSCVDQAAAVGVSPEILVAENVEARKILKERSVVEAARFCAAHQPKSVEQKSCLAIFKELIEARQQDGWSDNMADDIRSRLGRFAREFDRPIMSVAGSEISTWLRELKMAKTKKAVSRRTRNNYLDSIRELYRYSREQGYIPKTWTPLEEVPKVKNEPVNIQIFTPEEVVKLLAAARRRDLGDPKRPMKKKPKPVTPYLAIALFAGVRHEEMTNESGLPVLDWRNVDLDHHKEITIEKDVARKIGLDRILPMQPNLVEWLRLYAQPNGRICELESISKVLERVAEDAGVQWKHNGPRKSFISYRLAITQNIGLVAEEAGTSPNRIKQNYKKKIPKREASRYWEIWPTNAAVLQLPLAI